jgi:hypothetical protein
LSDDTLSPHSPGLDDSEDKDDAPKASVDWLKRARDAYRTSTTYIDSNLRKKWEDGIAAFYSQHPSDSKYNSDAFAKRSKIYRPKTRAIMRKNEAAAATAFFSNMDVVSITAENQGDPKQMASAEVMKALIQYRLGKTVPWFQTLLGGLQDTQKTGVCVSRQYWEFDAKRKIDKPCIRLIPIENFRYDPAAEWTDPVNTSPYNIEMMPMYVGDVKTLMKKKDPKTGAPKWKTLPDSTISQARNPNDSTRSQRNQNRTDPTDSGTPISDYEVCWVQRHIHRHDGEDWLFYTMGTEALLSEPELLIESVWHGKRDYVMGCCILETHITNPSGVYDLGKELQSEVNEVANQRLDNVKLVMNKRYFVKRGKNVDIASILRNVPGGATLMDDPENDVKESAFTDVTQSSYQEQDRLNTDFDELVGNFNAQSLAPQVLNQAPGKTMQLLAGNTSGMVEYLLRTFCETWVEPVLRQMVLLEQHYETDNVIMGLAAKQAKLLQRVGMDRVTDDLLQQELTVKVNVGMGATDPGQKLQKFVGTITVVTNVLKEVVPGLNKDEIVKEAFALSGYQDGTRFVQEDPEKLQLQQQIKQIGMENQQLKMLMKNKQDDIAAKREKTQIDSATKLKIAGISEHGQNQRALVAHISSMEKAGMDKETKVALHQPGPDATPPKPTQPAPQTVQ